MVSIVFTFNITAHLFCENLFEVLSKSLSHRLKLQRAKISNKAILFPFVQFAVFYNEIDLSLGWKFGTKFDLEVQQNSFQLLLKSFSLAFASSRPELGCRSPTPISIVDSLDIKWFIPQPSIQGPKDDPSPTISPPHSLKTASKKMSWYESTKHMFLKVVKWC